VVTHTYLGNYPNDHSSNWSDNLQGVAHSAEHWFFTQKTKLLKFHVTTDLQANSDQAVAVATMPGELASLGCNHFGDLDYFEWERQGYLFIPVEGDDCCGKLTFLAVFLDDDQLTYVGSTILPSQKQSLGTGRAGWCAINPQNYLLHSSSNEIKADLPVFRYEIDFDALKNGTVVLIPRSNLVLRENSATPNPIHIPKYMQGGAFSPDGWLYLSNGGDSADKDGGIRVFDTDGILQDRSSLTNTPFKYEFHSGWSKYEEPEGLTYWDIDELRQHLRIPHIEGQLHAILLDNDLGNDDIFFKHYRVDKAD
jgi:hypothetical protein